MRNKLKRKNRKDEGFVPDEDEEFAPDEDEGFVPDEDEVFCDEVEGFCSEDE